MPKGRVTINGVMIDLGSVKFFNKKERLNKKVSKECKNSCKDYGIEFQFYNGGSKTIWWNTETDIYCPPRMSSCLNICYDHRPKSDRNNMYDKLSGDFNIREY